MAGVAAAGQLEPDLVRGRAPRGGTGRCRPARTSAPNGICVAAQSGHRRLRQAAAGSARLRRGGLGRRLAAAGAAPPAAGRGGSAPRPSAAPAGTRCRPRGPRRALPSRAGVEHHLPAPAHLVGRQAEGTALVEGVHQDDEAVVELLPAAGGVEQLARVAAQQEAQAARLGEVPVLVPLLAPFRVEPDDVLDRRAADRGCRGRSAAAGTPGGCGAAASAAGRRRSGTDRPGPT